MRPLVPSPPHLEICLCCFMATSHWDTRTQRLTSTCAHCTFTSTLEHVRSQRHVHIFLCIQVPASECTHKCLLLSVYAQCLHLSMHANARVIVCMKFLLLGVCANACVFQCVQVPASSCVCECQPCNVHASVCIFMCCKKNSASFCTFRQSGWTQSIYLSLCVCICFFTPPSHVSALVNVFPHANTFTSALAQG